MYGSDDVMVNVDVITFRPKIICQGSYFKTCTYS